MKNAPPPLPPPFDSFSVRYKIYLDVFAAREAWSILERGGGEVKFITKRYSILSYRGGVIENFASAACLLLCPRPAKNSLSGQCGFSCQFS